MSDPQIVSSKSLSRCFALLSLYLCSIGCGETVPSSPPPKIAPKPVPTTAPLHSQPTAQQLGAPDREDWAVLYIQNQKVGHSHVTRRTIEEQGQKLHHWQGETNLVLNREGDPTKQRIELQSWETPAGKVVRFKSRQTSGQQDMQTEGVARDGQMIVTTETTGKRVTTAMVMPENCGGFFAVEQSLAKSPLKAGESRKVLGLMPPFHQPVETKLTCLGEEEVDIRGLKQKLLKVQAEMTIGPTTLTSFAWINDHGEMLKQFEPSYKMDTFRATKELALDKSDLGTIDLLGATTVKLKGELPKTRPLKKAVYLARLNDKTYPDQFSSDEFQRVEKVDDQTARLTITQIDRDRKIDSALVIDKPTNSDLAPNSLIQSDDPAIIALAKTLAPENAEPFLVALALEKGVRQHITKRNYSQAFATAAEVVRSQEGDCTENAVLLAAVCRARKIPARVVLGLVFYPPQNGFAYHMWNEVWLDGRWLPLDATVAQGAVGADHIKLRHASLQGQSALAVMLPLLQVVGRLELEVVTSE